MYRIDRILLFITLVLIFMPLHAAPVYHPYGSNLTFGQVSNGLSPLSDATNPAAGAATFKHQEGNLYRFGILSSIGAGVEYGQLDDLFDTIDEEAQAFQEGLKITDPADIPASVDRQVARLNRVLGEIQAEGYAKAFVSGELPFMPVVVGHEALGGALVLDINASATSKAASLMEAVDFDASAYNPLLPVQTIGDVTIDVPAQTFTVDNDSTLLTRGAAIGEIALGYSRLVSEREAGELFAGARLKYYRVGLSRVATRLGDVTNAQDVYEDVRDADFNWDEGFGFDLGVVWRSDNYHLGLTLANANEPEFEYNRLDTSTYDPAGPIARQLSAKAVYTMERQVRVEGSLFSDNHRWLLSGALDANAVMDPFGDEYQWLAVSAAYAGRSWFLPAARIGYRANLSGSELSYVTGGLTLFKIWTVDLAVGTDTVSAEGYTLPRSFIVNTGLEITL